MNIFWKMLETQLPKFLHSPHTPDFDRLLDKMQDGTITADELVMLRDSIVSQIEAKGKNASDLFLLIMYLPVVQAKLKSINVT